MIVLDTWAMLAYFDGDEPAGHIETVWLDEGATISSINLGEVFYGLIRRFGEDLARSDLRNVRNLLEVVDPDWEIVSDAARIKPGGGLSYADALLHRHRAPGRRADLDR